MFLCKQVRSEMGVDSVGVGGGEPGGVRGRCAPVGGDPPRRRVHPLALREWAGVFFSLARSAARRPLGCCRPAGHSSSGRRLVGGDSGRGSRRTARLGGWATRSRWWCRGDPAQGRGKARKAVFLSQALSRARRRLGVLAGPGRTGGRRLGPVGRPPRRGRCRLGRRAAATPLRSLVGDEPHGWRAPGWTTQVGTMESGQDRPGQPRAGRPARRSTRSARP